MTKYKVKVIHIFNELLEVEAENEQLAQQEASKIILKEGYANTPSYETTMSPDHWPVITEEEFNKFVTEQVEQVEPSNIITP